MTAPQKEPAGSERAIRDALAAGPTPGPWDVDSTKNDGGYGDGGPDSRSGFSSFVVIDAKGNAICDTVDSDVAEVEEWIDHDEGGATDVRGQKNTAFIAACNPEAIAALLAELDRLRASQPSGAAGGENLTDSYVQIVPDKCDRIVWRNNYYHLPLGASLASPSSGGWMSIESAPKDGTGSQCQPLPPRNQETRAMSDNNQLKQLIDNYGRACHAFGTPAWQSKAGEELSAALATLSHPATQAGALQAVAWMNSASLTTFGIDRERYPLGGGGDLATARYMRSDHHDTPLYLAATQPSAAPGDGQGARVVPRGVYGPNGGRPGEPYGDADWIAQNHAAVIQFLEQSVAAPSTATAAREQDEALSHAVLAMRHAQRGNNGGLAEAIDECNAALASREEAPAASVEPPSAKQQKLLDLADRIDHEELWRTAGIDHGKFTPEQKDRLNAGVALRRYGQLLAPGRWLVFPPEGNVHFSAGTLDAVYKMAKNKY